MSVPRQVPSVGNVEDQAQAGSSSRRRIGCAVAASCLGCAVLLVCIFGLLAVSVVGLPSILAVNFFGMAAEQKVMIATTQMKTLQGRLDSYMLEYGHYPSASLGLDALVNPPPTKSGRVPGAFLGDANLLTDPWGNPFDYSTPGPAGKPYQIISWGADGVRGGHGTDADINNWQGM